MYFNHHRNMLPIDHKLREQFNSSCQQSASKMEQANDEEPYSTLTDFRGANQLLNFFYDGATIFKRKNTDIVWPLIINNENYENNPKKKSRRL